MYGQMQGKFSSRGDPEEERRRECTKKWQRAISYVFCMAASFVRLRALSKHDEAHLIPVINMIIRLNWYGIVLTFTGLRRR